MIIGSCDDVYIYHFSSKSNIKSKVVSSENDMLYLKTEDGRIYGALSEGEPAVLFYRSEPEIVIVGCVVKSTVNSNAINVKCDSGHIISENKRLYERYPVSYYADLKVVNEPKRHIAYLKDISKYGLRIITDAELRIGSKVEISLYLEKRILFITALVVHGTKGEHYSDYGTVIKIEDYHSVREMSNLIRITTQEYMDRFINNNLLNDLEMSNYDLNYDKATNTFKLNENKNIDTIIAKFGDIIRRTKI